MPRKRVNPEPARPPHVTKAECARILIASREAFSRVWPERFEKHGWAGFYDDGCDVGEVAKGMREWDRLQLEDQLNNATDNRDVEVLGKVALAEKRLAEVQRSRGEMIYVPDFADEIGKMHVTYKTSQARVSRTMAPMLQAWLATVMAEEIANDPAVAKAFEKIKLGELEDWIYQYLNRSLLDMGTGVELAWRNAIKRAQIRAN